MESLRVVLVSMIQCLSAFENQTCAQPLSNLKCRHSGGAQRRTPKESDTHVKSGRHTTL